MDTLKSLYQEHPGFVKDIMHLHFFKTAMYYDSRMNDFPRLKISTQLKIALFMVDHARSYSIENGRYNFEIVKDFMFLPEKVPFPLLFNELIVAAYDATDIDNMFSSFYKSGKPILVRFAEQFKLQNIAISSELFDFIRRSECDPMRNWEIMDITFGDWNYTLLALNQRVWTTAFDKSSLNSLFQKEKEEFEKIDAENMTSEKEYQNYLLGIDSVIHRKLI